MFQLPFQLLIIIKDLFHPEKGYMEFPCVVGKGSGIVTAVPWVAAVAWVSSLAWEPSCGAGNDQKKL